jgi:SAM-dependent methyltransferase
MNQQGRRYDDIGHGYGNRRREDPHLRQLIHAALGDARTVVNVGAGTGSYEPLDRVVIPVEPSHIMASQRPEGSPVALRGVASDLPLHDQSVDAAMTVLSLHHWHPDQFEGIMELRRVARDTVVIVTIDAVVSGNMWLMADYLHEVAELDNRIFPAPETICEWLECDCETTIVPIPRDTPDGTLMSFWAHPERVLDADARNATSGFARQTDAVVDRVVKAVAADLKSGAWDARHGHLRTLDEFDAGLRMIRASLK